MSKIPAPDDRIGDRYRVVRLIGEGGMGAVYEAENLVTHKRVALKWLHPSVAYREESAQRLVREAQAASRVRHPNVVDVYDVVTHEQTIFLVLELLEGEALYAVIERGDMKVPAFIGLLLQAMRGVAAAHRQGIIHRDVHPGNIFLARSAGSEIVVKVLDFGISKLDSESSHSLTQSGTTMGTPLYMSYEQLCAVRDIDVRADIYSFGVILYRALTGDYPFSADSLTELAVKFATTKPATVKALRPEIPSALDRLVMACVARDRDQRPASLEALIEELEPFAAEDSFRTLLSGRNRQIPLVGRTHPSVRLQTDGPSPGQPPTPVPVGSPIRSVTSGRARSAPADPDQSVHAPVAAPSASQPPARPAWRAPMLIALSLLLLVGAGIAVLLPRIRREPAVEAPAALPRPPGVTPPATMQPEGPAVPATGNGERPAPKEAAPSKPARVWLPRPKPATPSPVPPPPTSVGDQPYFRGGRPPSPDDFK